MVLLWIPVPSGALVKSGSASFWGHRGQSQGTSSVLRSHLLHCTVCGASQGCSWSSRCCLAPSASPVPLWIRGGAWGFSRGQAAGKGREDESKGTAAAGPAGQSEEEAAAADASLAGDEPSATSQLTVDPEDESETEVRSSAGRTWAAQACLSQC